jgi:hypothetical protein
MRKRFGAYFAAIVRIYRRKTLFKPDYSNKECVFRIGLRYLIESCVKQKFDYLLVQN